MTDPDYSEVHRHPDEDEPSAADCLQGDPHCPVLFGDPCKRDCAAEQQINRLQMECARLRSDLTACREALEKVQADAAHVRQANENYRRENQLAVDALEKVTADRDELQQTFDLRWKADQRAIKDWREITGQELRSPDHADLVVWLGMQRDLMAAEILALREVAASAYQLAGLVGAPVRFLDVFSNAANGTACANAISTLLPVELSEIDEVSAAKREIEAKDSAVNILDQEPGMSDDYKRGYSKGYSTGCRRSDAEVARYRETRDQAIERAERAEAQQGLGLCADCKHWRREQACAWGYCTPPASLYITSRGSPLWFRAQDEKPITTSESFGCVMFKAGSRA